MENKLNRVSIDKSGFTYPHDEGELCFYEDVEDIEAELIELKSQTTDEPVEDGTKKYFLCFDVFSQDGKINKFFWCIVDINLDEPLSLINFIGNKAQNEAGLNIEDDNLSVRIVSLNNIS